MSAITDADRERGALFELVERVYAEGGPIAEKLRDKCRWEAMSPVAVLKEWPSIREECEALIAHAKKLERRLNRQKDKRRTK